MSTLGAKNIADISAEEITSAVNQVRNPAPIAANNVPASVFTAPQTPEVVIPEAQTPQVNAGAAIAGAEQLTGSIQEQEAQRREREVAQAGAVVSESERRLREGMGILGTESATRARMEEESGLNDAQKQLNQMSNQLFNQTAELRQFDVDNTNTIEQMRVDASRRDITKRTFGAMSAEAGIQMAVQRANMVGELYATQSSVQLMQGNIELATKSIDKALNAIYEPKRLEHQMEMMFLQRNWQLLDSAQNRAANARMEAIRQEQSQIDRAEDAVYNAVQNGYATADEVQEMMSLSDDPQAQRGMAQRIINRGAAQMRDLQMQQIQMSIAASAATINAKNQTTVDPMQAILLSLFEDGDAGVVSFEDYVVARTEGVQGPLTPEQHAQLEQEYAQTVANYSPQADKMQRLTFLVASGAVSPQQAEYIKENLQITSPKDIARQQEAAVVASTVIRDLNRMIPLLDQAGAGAQTLLDQIEARKGTEGSSWIPFSGMAGRAYTRKMATDAQDIYDLRNMIDSVQSNISLETLRKMRESSPTGGALGNVSDKQSALLASVLGNLELSQSPEILRQTAMDIGNLMLDAIHGSPEDIQNAFKAGRIDYNQAQTMIASRYNASPEMLQLPGISGANGNMRVQLAPNGDLVPIR